MSPAHALDSEGRPKTEAPPPFDDDAGGDADVDDPASAGGAADVEGLTIFALHGMPEWPARGA
ncbi:hypothetical protein [Allorhizocola rhizosphaerae]|uniref:hypothetical protein n=1 Tax=Allorhizocola rhizosphaerae TaxID=1872709 RepID=UPI0013C29F9D|nr:hypothetical protein [Allorhizocola rhizosphaerae]